MMESLSLAWKNVRHTRNQSLAVFLLCLCAAALMTAALSLGQGLRNGLTAAAEPFDLLAGSGGSYQMVLNTVFLQDYPTGNIPYSVTEELAADPRVAAAVPLAFGDTVRGYRVIGTTEDIFRHRIGGADSPLWLRFAEGGPFRAGSPDAVIGSRTACDLGLKIGDEIISSHGLIPGGADSHSHGPYRVSGILESCRGPYDQAVFVDLTTVWEAHGISAGGQEHSHDHDHENCDHQDQDHLPPHDHEDGHEHQHGGAGRREVTAVMIKPAGFAEAYQLYTDYGSRRDFELVFPAQAVVRLLAILGDAERLLTLLGLAAGLAAAATVGLTLYWSAVTREREAVILRLLGAERRDIVRLFLAEGALCALPGLLLGVLAGRGILALITGGLERSVSLHAAAGWSWYDAAFLLTVLAAGCAGKILAARQLTRPAAG